MRLEMYGIYIQNKNYKNDILDLTIEDGLIQFLKYNLTFILMKILTPILLIIVTASVIADDYSSGVMKFFLISKIDKKDVILNHYNIN